MQLQLNMRRHGPRMQTVLVRGILPFFRKENLRPRASWAMSAHLFRIPSQVRV